MKTIILGGNNTERLYLKPLTFYHKNVKVKVKPTNLPNLSDLIARHKARYYLVKSFIRSRDRVLDFPCGSGYGMEILNNGNIIYDGLDKDELTISYAKIIYGLGKENDVKFNINFHIKDLCNPKLYNNYYDVIACIEGIEHIERKYHKPLIKAFYRALRKGGTLIITTPNTGKTGKSKVNPYHLCELTYNAFKKLLQISFNDVSIITQRDTLHTGEKVNLMFGICHKGG